MRVNIHEAKINFSRLLVRVELGEEIILARAEKPIARLAPLERKTGRLPAGIRRRGFRTPDDLDAPLPPEVEETFWH